ncbi:MAG: YggU family protein [Candidatus Diapherotrites archaeon]|uniref:UPF0235 protein HY544_03095 n=1 Tax=Candidatus Iainarchaeum sp. TaxID=3101447 RepID=A0A8T3YIW4_9ARCH|nr:YggU family protein [Candidatus Diapherotrites archaeon]
MSTAKQSVELGLEVIPNSKKFAVMGFNPWTKALRVKVSAKALKGGANMEIIEELGKLFHAKTRIVSGGKSRQKIILLEGISMPEITEIISRNPKT